MTARTIEESGMVFGPFPEGRCFEIEKSRLYARIQNGVKMVEFLVVRSGSLNPLVVWVVEAKKIAPHPGNHEDFKVFLEDMNAKFTNALGLSMALSLNRFPEYNDELPVLFNDLHEANADVRFILVVKEHESPWLPQLQDALAAKLRPLRKTWGFRTDALVLNEERARSWNLII
jgi:hypothetical protein